MTKHSRRTTDSLLVTALAKGATVARAAHEANVGERTVYRRLKDPSFVERIERMQDETLQRTAAVVGAAVQEGVQSLLTLQDPATPPNVRRAAAPDILTMGIRYREFADLEMRLQSLEQNGLPNQRPAPATSNSAVSKPVRAASRRRRGDETLIAALAQGDSVTQAARKAGLSERTVYRRLEDPGFKRRLNDVQFDMLKRFAALLIAAGLLAAKTLIDLQRSPHASPAVRRRAAKDIVELTPKIRQATILESRLANLEKQAGNSIGET